ncbi:exodeoxyribonuclease VII large subunit [Saprospira grandis]|uniref:exodeoxyribonuclease VII large subunit n=1 Tax=Saprospira grandis TaxID=1008 RepID=UPI0022DE75B9|nr:exodeoxyribonuclease VII large subunit [Saprospira grandis]WBM74281.1 exodeoxyribonuclease VII large subunit [Saprospira grandis]
MVPESQQLGLFDLMQHLRRLVSLNLPQPLWLRAEIAQLKKNRSIYYLNLIEQEEQRPKAKAKALLYASSRHRISKKLGDTFWSIMREGQEVLIKVQAHFSEQYGFSLEILDLDASFSIGQLELGRLNNLKRLEQEHLIELNKGLELPHLPQRIAIISSKEAAGLQDFLEQLNANSQRYAFRTELFQAAMQGQQMQKEIREQIREIEEQEDCFDCVVLIRGGGAKLDLYGFNDYELCRDLAQCSLPVLTGIGHDIDESLADLVAHTALKTPTAVADFLVHQLFLAEQQLALLQQELRASVQGHIRREELRLEQLHSRLRLSSQERLRLAQKQLEHFDKQLELLSPDKAWKRGFAQLSNEEGQIIHSWTDLQDGQRLRLALKDGSKWIRINIEAIEDETEG